MSNLLDHARFEMRKMLKGDEMDRAMSAHVLRLLEVFVEEGHSGMSAKIALSLFDRLANFKPIGPLTGEADEWTDVSESQGRPLWQNRRCSSVFKDADGKAWDIDARVWEDEHGTRFTNGESPMPVTFPYTPPEAPIVEKRNH